MTRPVACPVRAPYAGASLGCSEDHRWARSRVVHWVPLVLEVVPGRTTTWLARRPHAAPTIPARASPAVHRPSAVSVCMYVRRRK
jgi:hypothetical protein